MKLNEEEIYEIEKFLLEEDLISLDFYNEMLDHFINAIADFKSLGHSFNESFLLTIDSFAKEYFSSNFGFSRFKGVKALEMRHYNKLYKGVKDKRTWAPISLILSKGGLFWIVGFPIYCLLGFELGWIWAFGLTILVAISLAINILPYCFKASLMHFNRWYRFMLSSLPERKRAQLKPNFRLFLVLDSFKATFLVMPWTLFFLGQFGGNPIIYTERGYILVILMNMLRAIIGYVLIMYMVDFWNQFKLEFKKIQH